MDDPGGPETRPIPDDVRREVVEPFIAATSSTLVEMAQTTAEAREVHATADPRPAGDVTVVLRLTPTPGAMLVLEFPGPTASTLADRVLAEAGGAPDDATVRDCMGEITNIIAGQAKAMLHGTPYRFAFSTPRILSGSDLVPASGEGRDFLVVVFASDAGDFTLRLCPAGREVEGG